MTTTPTDTQPATAASTSPDPRLIEELAEEYATLAADIEPKQARMEELKKQFRQLPKGTHDLAGLAVTVSANRRLNTKALEEAYPASEHGELYKQAIDTKAAREHLGEEMIEDFTVESENKVSVRVA